MGTGDRVVDFLRAAAERKRGRGTATQRERRARVDERNEQLQQVGVERGPHAPKDGTFGGKPSNE